MMADNQHSPPEGSERSLQSRQQAIELAYPLPIASVVRRFRTTSREDLGSRHKILIDLFEATVRYLAIVQLCELQQHVPGLKDRLPEKEKTLEFLKRPSLGGWIGLIRVLANLDGDVDKPVWSRQIAEWYNRPPDAANRAAFSLLREVSAVAQYMLALDQYLRQRVPDYQYQRHVGGAIYVFLRGIDGERRSASGLFYDMPSSALINTLRQEIIT